MTFPGPGRGPLLQGAVLRAVRELDTRAALRRAPIGWIPKGFSKGEFSKLFVLPCAIAKAQVPLSLTSWGKCLISNPPLY